ncbi:hypothetical protein K469DRAFT_686128 [Zopfia rhizophila CBS 207.26]|uniref:Uncharacterized protein n=1 Tax=Zopfia rhizophila CBS 207.26 TaxID=1314779 RepID=A0A6A6E520_9PEZI|nr:hypothetical protein K469DRAFT_686128 [Zopfia rhizophila CBS 207.26]
MLRLLFAFTCVITGLHVYNTIRPDAQVQALQTWKRLLVLGGRMVISFSALINGTECPASVTLIETPVPFQTQLLNTGQSVINRRIVAQKKIAPSAMWDQSSVSESSGSSDSDASAADNDDRPPHGEHKRVYARTRARWV